MRGHGSRDSTALAVPVLISRTFLTWPSHRLGTLLLRAPSSCGDPARTKAVACARSTRRSLGAPPRTPKIAPAILLVPHPLTNLPRAVLGRVPLGRKVNAYARAPLGRSWQPARPSCGSEDCSEIYDRATPSRAPEVARLLGIQARRRSPGWSLAPHPADGEDANLGSFAAGSHGILLHAVLDEGLNGKGRNADVLEEAWAPRRDNGGGPRACSLDFEVVAYERHFVTQHDVTATVRPERRAKQGHDSFQDLFRALGVLPNQREHGVVRIEEEVGPNA